NNIESKDTDIQAYLSVFKEEALNQAQEIDKRRNKKESLSPLAGIPFALKDNMLVSGFKATAGSKILENYVSTYDATVVSKLKKAGAILLGKTNMDEFAMGSSTENSAFFTTKNPHDLSRVPGGSSGGSAASVAAEMSVFTLGSDTGGSVRQPASFCGVIGFKPSYGAVSRYGLMSMASSLDVIGPFCQNVEDVKLIFETISGKDDFDATSIDVSRSDIPKSLKGLKIGIPKEYFVGGLDQEVELAIHGALEKIQKEGADIVEISLPQTKYALPCYYIIMPAEVSSNLARYDGIRYAPQEKEIKGELWDLYLKNRGDGFGEESRRRIILGTYVLSAGYYDAYYLKAQKVRQLIRLDFKKAFESVDFIITPTAPTTAFKIGEKAADPVSMYLSDIFTVSANLAGLPAISLPIRKEGKLPIGLQVIGPYASDHSLLNMAELTEKLI
ncbi:MAG: Asp-tRNA(Asn)/Glu-tRNA(Gln) amidotransferase subunit GatA, partial [Candidatus Parcubacteria bacterium]|nr:Asp-tRNA(Asn)/Glu-tRNA(Gln) amidotransferase subunit GatA [Candidatus Parcubacteria bacterium]